MIITNNMLLDLVMSLENEPKDLEDLKLYHNFLYEIDLSDEKIREYLGRNIKNLNIDFRKIKEDEYNQLYELIKVCSSLNMVRFTSTGPVVKIDNEMMELLLSNKNIRGIMLNRNVSTDYNYLMDNLDKREDFLVMKVDSLLDLELEKRYLNLSRINQTKLSVSKFKNDVHARINSCQKIGKVDVNLYFDYFDYFNKLDEITIVINNVSELGLDKLELLKKDSRIKRIFIRCGYQDGNSYYSLIEYENVLKEINGIISLVNMPDSNNSDREKIIFSQIYKIIGERIVYDNYAISKEGKEDSKLASDCRNLKNGLLGVTRNCKKEYTCVCAGYANILQNVCSLYGIECNYISSSSREVYDKDVFRFGEYERVYENGTNDPMGHAYNSVCLDGELYFCDLTWDSSMIRANGIVEHFLKSYDDFYDSHFCVGFAYDNVRVIDLNGRNKYSVDKDMYNKSLSIEEQKELFGISMEMQIDEMISIGYLGGFVLEYLNFVKECKSKVELEDLQSILNTVTSIEKYVLSLEFKDKMVGRDSSLAIPVVVNDNRKNIAFYTSDTKKEEVIKSVEGMIGRGR